MTAHEFIDGYSAVISAYGRWPRFHDGYVRQFAIRSSGVDGETGIDLLVHGFDMTSETDERGYYKLRNHHLIHFRFEGTSQLDFEDLDTPDAILRSLEFEALHADSGSTTSISVALMSSYGMSGTFRCQSAKVLSVKPCDSKGIIIDNLKG